jgi:hypothetical protein
MRYTLEYILVDNARVIYTKGLNLLKKECVCYLYFKRNVGKLCSARYLPENTVTLNSSEGHSQLVI